MFKRRYPKQSGIPLRPELDRQTRFQETIHEHHWNARAVTINALADPDHPEHAKAARRMAACGHGASFFIDSDKEQVRPWISRCGHRLCPFCSNARSASTSADLIELMVEHQAKRMIILTLRSHDLPLHDQVKQLLYCFKKLRARTTWKNHITGGVYVLEITRNPESGLWHPHLHILVRGSYYPHAELSKQWRSITGDSNVVWLTAVKDIEGAAAELAKYIGKPQRVADLPPAQIREYATATKSVRMVQTFGDLHNRGPRDEDQTEEPPRNTERVRLSTLLHIARSGHNEAIILLTWLCRRYKVFGRYVFHEAPQLVPDPGGYDRAQAALAMLRGEPAPRYSFAEDELTEEQIDHKICQAFMCYKAQLEQGTFGNVHWYHPTETENIDGYIRR
jgi:hypothetical protein|tara:strand:+ start:2326 stop:3504 length:1179 start_codon:yes stop_codon:yes gene_type:complete